MSSQQPSKRLAFFVGTMEGGGAERVMLNLANHFADDGYQVDLVLAQRIGPLLQDVSEKVTIIDLKVNRAWNYIGPLVRYFYQARPDAMLVATTILNILAITSKALAFSRTRLVVSEHIDIISYAASGGLQRAKWVKMAIRLFYPWANSIVAVSNGAADGLAKFSGIKRQRISTIYNGVVDKQKLEMAKEYPQHAWFKNKKLPVLVAVGRLEAQKDYPNLLKAFSLVLKEVDARLLVLGEGVLRKSLEQLVDELNIGEQVSLPGFVDNPFSYLAHADIFVLSSKFEGLPTVLIEALACGSAIVSTDCPSGPDEILEHGKYGFLVPTSDHEQLAQAIIKTLKGEAKISREDRQTKGLSFSVKVAVENYSQVLGLADS